MTKRVGIIALLQESNTFIAQQTTRRCFEQDLLLTGPAIRERLAGTHHEVGGFFAGLAEAGLEAVPIFAARALPFGVMTAETFDQMMVTLRDELARAGTLDGLLVAPHGATVSQHVPDVDGHWLDLARQCAGPRCPIIGTLDPHANLSPAMVGACDALIAYRTNPHMDQRERGLEAAELMARTLAGTVRPTQAAAFPPLAINIECQQTDVPPCRPIYEAAAELRNQRGVLSTSICLGFPYADVPEMGAATLVVTDADMLRARALASQLAEQLWNARQTFHPRLVGVDEALQSASALDGPVCLLDMGDNVGGGSPGDGTYLARALEQGKLAGAFVCLCDAEAAKEGRAAGVAARLTMSMGGKTDRRHGEPLRTPLTVISHHDGRFVEHQPRHGGFSNFNQGPTTIVRTDNGLTIMLTSLRMAPFSLQQLRHCGLDPAAFRILVAKGVHAPVAAYREVCRDFIRVNTAGSTAADLGTFDYRNRRRPMFPWEAEASWHVHEGAGRGEVN